MIKVVFLGPPGAGKGTFANMLAEDFHPVHISTGDILRAEMKEGTELGEKARQYVESGRLVSDEVVTAIVAGKLARPETRRLGFILDGFPRTVRQAELLDEAMREADLELDAAILFHAERDLLLKRLTARRICRNCGAVYNVLFSPPRTDGVCDKCGGELYQRSDDTRETAVERLQVYEQQTAPVIEFYRGRGLLHEIDSGQPKESVGAALRRLLER